MLENHHIKILAYLNIAILKYSYVEKKCDADVQSLWNIHVEILPCWCGHVCILSLYIPTLKYFQAEILVWNIATLMWVCWYIIIVTYSHLEICHVEILPCLCMLPMFYWMLPLNTCRFLWSSQISDAVLCEKNLSCLFFVWNKI